MRKPFGAEVFLGTPQIVERIGGGAAYLDCEYFFQYVFFEEDENVAGDPCVRIFGWSAGGDSGGGSEA